MIIIKSHIVPENVEDIRLYDYAQQIFTMIPSRKGIKKAISRGEIIVDGSKATTGLWIKTGQQIDLLESNINPPKAYALSLEVVFEDEYLAIINKPAGIPVSGNQYRTIQNALISNLKLSNKEDALRWVKPVHRLDSPTSGLLLVAKTATALMKLGQLFEQKKINKLYSAVVMGEIEKEGEITIKIEGQDSFTEFKREQLVPSLKSGYLSLVELSPKTGRTHQLRVHLSELGCPIVGDPLYGDQDNMLKGKGLFLCAKALHFIHPITNEELDMEIDLPHKFNSLLERETRRWKKFQ